MQFIGGSRIFWKGGGVAASHDFFCPPFGPERGGFAALKIVKNDLFWIKFSDQSGGCNPRNPPPRSANAVWKVDIEHVTCHYILFHHFAIKQLFLWDILLEGTNPFHNQNKMIWWILLKGVNFIAVLLLYMIVLHGKSFVEKEVIKLTICVINRTTCMWVKVLGEICLCNEFKIR